MAVEELVLAAVSVLGEQVPSCQTCEVRVEVEGRHGGSLMTIDFPMLNAGFPTAEVVEEAALDHDRDHDYCR